MTRRSSRERAAAAQRRAEFGEDARRRRERVLRRISVDRMPARTERSSGAIIVDPEKLRAINFEQPALDALLASWGGGPQHGIGVADGHARHEAS
jgi:hypothetical protein